MRRIISVLSVFLLLPAFTAQAGKIVTDSVNSSILGAEVKYNIYRMALNSPESSIL